MYFFNNFSKFFQLKHGVIGSCIFIRYFYFCTMFHRTFLKKSQKQFCPHSAKKSKFGLNTPDEYTEPFNQLMSQNTFKHFKYTAMDIRLRTVT